MIKAVVLVLRSLIRVSSTVFPAFKSVSSAFMLLRWPDNLVLRRLFVIPMTNIPITTFALNVIA